MTTKSVLLAQKTGDGADVLLPHTSADLVGYENADVAGVTDVAAALDDLFAKSPGNISVLTGRVDALESGQVEQDADISAAGAAAADWTASKPGIVQRVEALEALGPGSIYTDSSLTRNENLEYGVNVAPGGPDNYLEKTAQGLAVRGVQTAGNKVWNKGSGNLSVGVIAVADGYRNLILGDLAANANMPPVDDIVSVNAANGLITILEDGVYHWRVKLYAAQATADILWALLFKKVGDGYAVLAEGVPFAPMPSAVTNPHLLIDFHGRYAKGDQVLIGLRTGDGWTTPTKIEMEFQLFADAALLAPALVQSRSQIYSCYLQGISREEALSVDGGFWHPLGFDSVIFPSFQLPADNIVTPVKHASTASKTDAFKILADGIYHLQIWTYYQSTAEEDQVSASVYIYKNGDSTPYQLNAETADINGVGYYNHVNIDAHIRLEAGDIVVFCGGTVNNSNIVSAKVYIQLFPDTLSHPNHGVSQDAGNMAQVGNDLGVMVPKGAPYTLTALPANANIDALDAGVYLVPVSTTLQGHIPPSWAGSDDAVLIVFEDGNDPQVRRQRWLSSTNMFYREFYLSQVDLAIAAWNTLSAPSPRPPIAEDGSTLVVGSIVTVAQAANVNAPYVVPAGGVWMVSVIFTDASGHVIDSMSYVVAGGTTVIPVATNYAVIRGFCWRII